MTRPAPLTILLVLPLLAAVWLPFVGVRPNRIAPPDQVLLADVFGTGAVAVILLSGLAVLLIAHPVRRGAVAGILLIGWLWGLGMAAGDLHAAAGPIARISPAGGFWIVFAALALLVMDAIARTAPGPWLRVGLLAGMAAVAVVLLRSGMLDDVSILQEYAARRDVFWAEARRHLTLALGSFVAAMVAGVPLGILCQRKAQAGGPILGVLTVVQTIPSIALFGVLIVPLGWLASHVPNARAWGIGGIGMAPAAVALFLYALLPIVANTVAGLNAVPPAVAEAARGMGFRPLRKLVQVDLPLALPVVLTGARIVLVQGIGLATVGALVGAGGFGTFVFQGLGQTAPDLILLGALPTVLLAFSSSILLGAMVDGVGGRA